MTRVSAAKAPPWLMYVGFATLVVGIITNTILFAFWFGQLAGDVRRNTERIVAMEVAEKSRSEADQQRTERAARIEAKIDVMAEKRP